MAGKTPVVELRDGLGKATYNPKTMRIEFPSTVPASRIPQVRKGPAAKPGKSLVAHLAVNYAHHSLMNDNASVLFYVDSGVGQCLCSCISAFVQMTPCRIEITGVSGLLEVFGCGTALFIVTDSYDNQVILRVNNCLFSYGEFNLLSVSQLNLVNGNGVDFSRQLSFMTLHSGSNREFRIPLVLDDGLYGIQMEPLQTDDPRYSQFPKCDVTPKGDFVMGDNDQLDGWRQKVLAFAFT
jgi:hypothetical protein